MEAGAAQGAAPVAASGAAVAAPTSAPSPQYTPPPPPAMPQPPMMADGGETPSGASSSGFGGKVKEFFSDINILDVAISAFIVGGVLYAVHYYKFMIALEKSGYADLSTRVQRLESQMAAAKKSAEMNATGNGKMPMRRKRALVTL